MVCLCAISWHTFIEIPKLSSPAATWSYFTYEEYFCPKSSSSTPTEDNQHFGYCSLAITLPMVCVDAFPLGRRLLARCWWHLRNLFAAIKRQFPVQRNVWSCCSLSCSSSSSFVPITHNILIRIERRNCTRIGGGRGGGNYYFYFMFNLYRPDQNQSTFIRKSLGRKRFHGKV